MHTISKSLTLTCLVLTGFLAASKLSADDRPNIVLIYADDLGYGDVGCYGATSVKTPAIDRIAKEGIRFTDGHSPSATCTPSRYAMLTGEYAWRRQGTGIAKGNAPLIIDPDRKTLPDLFSANRYQTGVVGKWHLGLGDQNMDWNKEIKPGPLELGFDYCYLIPATGDRVPTVYVENHHIVDLDPNDPITVSFGKPLTDLPTGKDQPELLKMHPSHGHNQTIINGISRIGYMSGGKSAWWKDEDMADVITEKAVDFIEKNKSEPFFLYFSYHDIHVPRVPHPRFVGSTAMGPRGDAIAQLDWCTEQILNTLDRLELNDNTLVIFTSDNGPVVDDGYKDDAVKKLGKHRPAGDLRGGKYSAFEGGTRIPFIARWTNNIKAGQVSDALMCQIDFPATFAALLSKNVSSGDFPDSENHLQALLGQQNKGRNELVEHARVLAFRRGDWKYIESSKGPSVYSNTNIESGFAPTGQLFNLKEDPRERNNLIKSQPEKALMLQKRLKEIQAETTQ